MLLVNEFDCNFDASCLMLRQNHLAKAAFADYFQLCVLGEKVALACCVLIDLQKAIKQLFVAIEEYVSCYLPNQCKSENLAGLLALFLICSRTLHFGSKKALELL